MKINFNPYITYNRINFKGNRSSEETNINPFGSLVHLTCFFREPRTDYIIKDYVLKNFSNEPKIKIVNGACSSGEETYSLGMLFSEMKDKVDITGFDISPKTIEQAQEGVFTVHRLPNSQLWNITSAWHDSFLIDNSWPTAQQKEQKELFYKYFKQTDNQTYVTEKQDFKANDEIKEMCNFEVGDINNLSKMYKKNSLHVLTFKNALYHLVTTRESNGGRHILINDAEKITTNIVKQAHEVLKPNGIFVFGENEAGQGIDNQMIYRIMTQNGFEPAIELSKSAKKAKRCNVWKKV